MPSRPSWKKPAPRSRSSKRASVSFSNKAHGVHAVGFRFCRRFISPRRAWPATASFSQDCRFASYNSIMELTTSFVCGWPARSAMRHFLSPCLTMAALDLRHAAIMAGSDWSGPTAAPNSSSAICTATMAEKRFCIVSYGPGRLWPGRRLGPWALFSRLQTAHRDGGPISENPELSKFLQKTLASGL
jgi:hypothetical protein